MLPFDSVLIVGTVLAAVPFALVCAPRTALAALLAVAALAQTGAINPSSLPLAGEASAVADSVSAWQQERIDAGACHFGTMNRLAEADPSTPAELPESCDGSPAPRSAPAAVGTIAVP